MDLIDYLYIFTLAAFTGYVLIQKVPSQLHTPLMSGSNAISGITIVGAILAAGSVVTPVETASLVEALGEVDFSTVAVERVESVTSFTATALPATVTTTSSFGTILGFVALVLATINVVGGYMVTDRMLGMFRSKKK